MFNSAKFVEKVDSQFSENVEGLFSGFHFEKFPLDLFILLKSLAN